MDEDDKPFACSFPGCNQKFVTEDRLSFHIQKHDLNFEGLTSALFTDQTPTPTTFLKDCENMGLFQDLPLTVTSKNPFDESFRRAAIDPDADDIGDTGEMETPSIPILPDSANILQTPTSSSSKPLRFLKCRPTFLTPDVNKLHSQMSNDNLDTPSIDNMALAMMRHTPDTPSTPPANVMLDLGLKVSRQSSVSTLSDGNSSPVTISSTAGTPVSIHPPDSPDISQIIPSPQPSYSSQSVAAINIPTAASDIVTTVSQLPMNTDIKTLATTTTILGPGVPQRLPVAPKVVPVTNNLRPANPSQSLVMLHINKSGGAYLVPANQIVTAQAMNVSPVKLTSNNLASNNLTQVQAVLAAAPPAAQLQMNSMITPVSTASTGHAENSAAALLQAKLRLKQALTKDPGLKQAVGMTLSNSSVSDSETTSSRSRHSSQPQNGSASMAGIKRALSQSDNDEHLDEEEKRTRSLQRNRDAARRCRKKKKFQMQNLEDKVKTTNHINAILQSENTRLKMEIAELKCLFIQHKDCEVTQKQLADGQLNSLLQQPQPSTQQPTQYLLSDSVSPSSQTVASSLDSPL